MSSAEVSRVFMTICILFSAAFIDIFVAGSNSRYAVRSRTNITRSQIDKIVKDHILKSGLPIGDAQRISAKFMMELYEKVTNQGQNLFEATGHNKMADKMAAMKPDTIRTISAKVDAGRLRNRGEINLMFDVSGIDKKERIQLAELRVKAHRHERHRVTHYRIIARLRSHGKYGKRRKFTIGTHRDEIGGFRVLSITTVLEKMRRFIKGGDDLLELSLNSRRSTRIHENRMKQRFTRYVRTQEAILLLLSEEKDFLKQHLNKALANVHVAKRVRRTSEKRNKNRNRNKSKWKRAKKKGKPCAKYDFQISFDDVGWSKWIIYPKDFNAQLCAGGCPSPVTQDYDPTNHAVMQSLMQHKDKSVLAPCCVPTKLSPLSLLYFEFDEIVMRHHEEMVVDTCGCR
ncbi:nodal homolog [Tubulanus polymorphus]|uniref:nodal homolog n=1 Tax=Tubulanus polymorphus TaxID=672921 RepID=UPI003DA435B4